MSVEPIVLAAVILAAIPALLTAWNYLIFRSPPRLPEGASKLPGVSILIPARDEAANIEGAVQAALASEDVRVEVVVLDDHSTDDTAALVQRLAENDDRVRLELAPDLPDGWCGKQHACARLAEHARYDLMLFIDADVRMKPAAVGRMVAFLEQSGAELLSAFPHQVTGTFLEKLMIPLIEFVLLGYLPLWFARISVSPGFAAGCGQVFLARRAAYESSGGHGAIRESLHDGIKLPRAFREAGYRTDVCVGDGSFQCRMYCGAREVWAGLLKNAHEGIASPALIVPFSVLLFGAGILPVLLAGAFAAGLLGNVAPVWILVAVGLSYLPRALNAIRFRQSWLGVALHPISIALFLILQWQAFFRRLTGRRPQWRGRSVG